MCQVLPRTSSAGLDVVPHTKLASVELLLLWLSVFVVFTHVRGALEINITESPNGQEIRVICAEKEGDFDCCLRKSYPKEKFVLVQDIVK